MEPSEPVSSAPKDEIPENSAEIINAELEHPNFGRFLKNGKYFDTILVHENTGAEYPCHKVILSSNSAFFDSAFSRSFKEKESEKIFIRFNDPENCFPYILEFLYKGRIIVPTEKVVALRMLSEFLLISKLSQTLVSLIPSFLTTKNCFKVLLESIKLKDDSIVEVAAQFIAQHFLELADTYQKPELMDALPPQIYLGIIGHPDVHIYNTKEKNVLPTTVNKIVKNYMEIKNARENTDIFALCIDALFGSQCLQPEDSIEHLKVCEKLQLTKQIHNCVENIAQNIDKLGINNPTVHSLWPSAFLSIVRSDSLRVRNENEVWNFCFEYLSRNKSTLSFEQMQEILSSVRMPFLSPETLGKICYFFSNNMKEMQCIKDLAASDSEDFSQWFPTSFKQDLVDDLFVRIATLEKYELDESTLKPRQRQRKSDMFVYVSDFDTNGIIYWLGTAGKTKEWSCPYESKDVDVIISPELETGTKSNLIGRVPAASNLTNQPNGFVQIVFKDLKVSPTCYTVRHTTSRNEEALRNWRLQGSVNNDGTWEDVDIRVNDATITKKDETATFQCNKPTNQFFESLRILQDGVNSSSSNYLSLAGFEVYGLTRPK